MKKLLFLFLIFPLPLQAGYIHKISASAQGVIDGSYSQAKRIGSTYSMSSTGITAGTMGHLDSPALDNSSVLTGVAATHGTGSYTQTTAGAATSFSESFIQGDAVVTTASVSSGVVSSLPVTGDTITYSGGSSSGQSIGITSVSGGTITLSSGAAGSSVTGSITSTIEID